MWVSLENMNFRVVILVVRLVIVFVGCVEVWVCLRVMCCFCVVLRMDFDICKVCVGDWFVWFFVMLF